LLTRSHFGALIIADMKHASFISLLLFVFLLSACGPSPEQQSTLTATAMTATAAAWTRTPTFTQTFTLTSSSTPTLTYTPTSTYTPTASSTPTASNTPTASTTPTITPTPTYDFPKVRVNVANLHCQFGPNKAYLHARDLHEGDKGLVWGRDEYNTWLYVRMDNLDIPCWVHKAYVDIDGDITRMLVQQVRLPIVNNLYAPPTGVQAERDGDEVTVFWNEVWMTLDDDRGYFLEVWVCQGGYFVWVPASLPNQYQTEFTFTDEPGCPQESYGQIRTVEKHGYTDAVPIPWPR